MAIMVSLSVLPEVEINAVLSVYSKRGFGKKLGVGLDKETSLCAVQILHFFSAPWLVISGPAKILSQHKLQRTFVKFWESE